MRQPHNPGPVQWRTKRQEGCSRRLAKVGSLASNRRHASAPNRPLRVNSSDPDPPRIRGYAEARPAPLPVADSLRPRCPPTLAACDRLPERRRLRAVQHPWVAAAVPFGTGVWRPAQRNLKTSAGHLRPCIAFATPLWEAPRLVFHRCVKSRVPDGERGSRRKRGAL